MIFCRIAGGVLLLLCSISIAVSKNRSAEAEIEEIEGFLSLLGYVQAQIECFGLPISEIFMRCDKNTLRRCGFEGNEPPRDLSQLVTEVKLKNITIRAILNDFASDFGKNYRSEEIRQCEYYISCLKEEREHLVSELPRKKKLNTTLSLAAAAALIILLI